MELILFITLFSYAYSCQSSFPCPCSGYILNCIRYNLNDQDIPEINSRDDMEMKGVYASENYLSVDKTNLDKFKNLFPALMGIDLRDNKPPVCDEVLEFMNEANFTIVTDCVCE